MREGRNQEMESRLNVKLRRVGENLAGVVVLRAPPATRKKNGAMCAGTSPRPRAPRLALNHSVGPHSEAAGGNIRLSIALRPWGRHGPRRRVRHRPVEAHHEGDASKRSVLKSRRNVNVTNGEPLGHSHGAAMPSVRSLYGSVGPRCGGVSREDFDACCEKSYRNAVDRTMSQNRRKCGVRDSAVRKPKRTCRQP